MTAATPERRIVGERIRALRIARDMTQAELARACYVSQSFVAYWETGRRMPRPAVQRNVADILAMPRHILFREVIEAEELEARSA